MNMFIGVLSNAYATYSERKVEMYHHYKAKVALRCMLRRRVWLWLLRRTCSACCRDHVDEHLGIHRTRRIQEDESREVEDEDEDDFLCYDAEVDEDYDLDHQVEE